MSIRISEKSLLFTVPKAVNSFPQTPSNSNTVRDEWTNKKNGYQYSFFFGGGDLNFVAV